MKRSVVLTAILLSACSQVPPKPLEPAPVQPVVVEPTPDLVPDEVVHSDNAEAVPTDFGLIFIDRDMSFKGTLPCKKCPGIQYQLNLMQDGRFELRREYIDRNTVELLSGQWQLDDRTLHFSSKQGKVPSFQFGSNQHLILLDNAGKPMVSKENQTLTRASQFSRIDTRMPLLGLYQLKNNEASFIDCMTGESHYVAMTQHHMPMLRTYQTDPKINGKAVVATLTARKSNEQQNALLVDKFDQFWPGATCPDKAAVAKVQNLVWRLQSVSQISVPQKLNIRVMFDDNNRLYGFSGCNNFNAGYSQQNNQLKVMPIVSTRKFCNDANFYEQQFTKQLQLADRIEVNQQKLQLYKDNQVIMEFLPAIN